MHNPMKPLRLYLLINPADEPLKQPLSENAFELTGFLRGLNQQDYAVEIFTLMHTTPLLKRLGLSPEAFPVITIGTDVLCTRITPTDDELSELLRLGCETTGADSSCCSGVDPLREQAATLQASIPDIVAKLAHESVANGSGKPGVLFVCCHNSCRSQMAEAFLRQVAGDRFDVQSCGLTTRPIHPLTIAVMDEIGVDLSRNASTDWRAVIGRVAIRHAVFVCDVDEKQCPRTFPFSLYYHRHCFKDPAAVQGSREEQMQAFREVRDEIKAFTETFARDLK